VIPFVEYPRLGSDGKLKEFRSPHLASSNVRLHAAKFLFKRRYDKNEICKCPSAATLCNVDIA